ncbi:hypothetical protein C8R43DRAFT_74536 [Mycena crocata]|nr:hypothetical protein C8R43DRAFT_74536 [Mycena crocata]
MLCDACKHPLLPPDALPTPGQTDALRQFLRSGALALDTSQYRAQIATSEAGLARYDAEIGRLQETLRDLFADRSKLQEYTDGLRATMSPIRALPAEILGEIFTPFSLSGSASKSYEEELDNLAKVDLLDLSKVCSRWHRVVLGTPRLWSDIAVDLYYCQWSEDAGEFIHLLSTALKRGAHHPLTLSLVVGDYNNVELEHSVSTFTLVAQHSRRWKHMYFRGHPSGFDSMSHIKGKLDILETLSIEWEQDAVVDLFEIAPRLTKVSVNFENAQLCPKLPWDQLRSFTCIDANSEKISHITGLMQSLSHPEAAFELLRFYPAAMAAAPDHPPAVTSTISSFLVEMWPNVNLALGDIFGCLTLPHLRKLFVVRVAGSKGPIPWPAKKFESLSLRSSLCDTLRVLELTAVAITDDELLRCLASLGSLEHLFVSDQPEFGNRPEYVLITDTLLLRLTHPPDLIPKLRTFTCTSLYKFNADIYFNFVASRILAGQKPLEPFRCILRHFADTPHDFDSSAHQKLLELVQNGELELSIGEEEVS